VFIDVGIKVGTDWVDEIERRIDSCDALIVLLSDASCHSEMVLGEVRRAHRRRRKNGRPYILPIRVHYEGPLDYELDSYLARIQYVRWQAASDTSRVVKEILAARSPGAQALGESLLVPPSAEIDAARPQPSEDIRQLFAPPGGNIKLNDEFYVRGPEDNRVEAMALRRGETLVIKAPRQCGKSSLLMRYLAKCSEKDESTGLPRKRFVLVDFQNFTDPELEQYSTLLTRLAELLLRGFRLNVSHTLKIGTQAELSNFIEDEIFPRVAPPLTLAFDEVDRVIGKPYQRDFFTMLRLWHNRRAEPLSPWETVDLALVIATEPHLLIDSGDRSPFNVVPPVELEPFGRSTLDDLNIRYKSALSAKELDGVYDLVAGHRFLTRLAFYRIVSGEVSGFDDLDARAGESDGPFGDHLRSLLVILKQEEGLLLALRGLIAQESTPDESAYFRLHAAGLVRREGRRMIPANLLYARFFRALA
jgi:hypothetical protein